ncbi:hypothetical protein QN367_12180 [Cryobacterium sp. RTS3]|uniref:ApeA N-terminal domain 1-containing protein n=1 Tax=Cryobacterium sp. RTS3 TaxID=3048643 RepID=UPI002B223BA5|nr:HEPN domain-containing protein [Cryobacterium sp. RTS3]MEA9999855.1 hypothetical protein [Cryobacterium sp. RTS3]
MVDDTVFGEWWLPEEEQARASGALALSSRFAKLSLVGSLEPASAGLASLFSEPSTHPVVFGSEMVPDRKVTIFNASGSVVHNGSLSNPVTRQDLNITGTILFGCHLADSSLPVVSTITARIFGLGHWLGAKSVLGQRETSATDPSRTLAILVSHSPKLEAIEIRKGTSLQFFFTYSESTVYGAEGTVLSLTDDGAAQLSYETPATLAEAEDDVALLVRLVTFFTGSTSWVQSQVVTLGGDSSPIEVWRGGRPDFEVPETSDLGQREVLHSTQIELSSVVTKWYELNRGTGRAGVNVLQAHHFKVDQYVETGFLAAVTAFDVLYRVLSTGREQELPTRKAANPDAVSKAACARKILPPELQGAIRKTGHTDTPLRSQLGYLLTWIGPQQFAEVVPVDKQASWTDLTKDVRNSITHDGDFTAWVDSGGLLALQLQVRWLLKLAILKHLDVSDDQLVMATLHSAEGRSASYTCRYLPTLQSGVE